MTNDGWNSKWPSGPVFPQQLINEAKREEKEYTDIYDTEINPVALFIGWDKAEGSDKTTIVKIVNVGVAITEINKLKSQGSNLVDEQAYLYFQCESCNEILDLHTKSFKALEDARFKAGWKVKWNIDGMGYKVYCAKCGE